MKRVIAITAAVVVLGLVGTGVFLFSRQGQAVGAADMAMLGEVSTAQKRDVVPILRPLGVQNALPVQAIEAIPQDSLKGGLVGRALTPQELPLMDRFVGNLSIRYAIDGETMMRDVSPRLLEQLGATREELRAIAVANLHRRYPTARVERQPGFSMVVGGGDLESSWMLDFAFWEKEAAKMKGVLVASVPSREVMVWCDSADADVLKMLREKGNDVHASEQASNRAVSPFLYAWKEGRWEVFTPP